MPLETSCPPQSLTPHQSLEKMILRDFYLSFKYTQGDGPSHIYFLDALAATYRKTQDPENYRWIQTHADEILGDDHLLALKVPRSHSVAKGNQRPGAGSPLTFGQHGVDFKTALSRELPINFRTISRQTIVRDLRYQVESRSYQTTDPHSSYFRQYILLGEPTGSHTFDTVFAETKEWEQINRKVHIDDLLELQAFWEGSHPGESFYPDEPTPQ